MSLANLHTLQDSETDLNSEFKQQRFAILKLFESSVPTPYFDKKGIITIGIGFNIDTVDANRGRVMTAMGLTDAQQANINTAWNSPSMGLIRAMPQATEAERDAKDTALATYLSDMLGVAGQTFSMTDPQIKTVFDKLVFVHQNAIDSLVSVPSLEQIVLTSLHYNGLVGPGLTTALALPDPADARAEAWYQIRYDHKVELQKRRYAEAALFGLYDEVASVNLRLERHHLARQEEIMKTPWMGLVAGFVLGQARTADFGEDPTFRYKLEGKDRKEKKGGLKISQGDEH